MKKITAVLLTIVVIFGAAACTIGGIVVDVYEYRTDNYLESVGEYSPTGEVRELKIDWVAGTVRVVEGSVARITVRQVAVGEAATVNFYYRMNGKMLSVAFAKNGTKVRNMTKDLVVTVPKGTVLDKVDVSATSATVKVELDALDTLAVEAVAGGVDCKINALGRAEICTTSAGATLFAQAQKVKMETVSGTLNFATKHSLGELSLQSTSGAVNITLPTDASFTLVADTTSGKISTGPFACTVSGKRYIAGTGEATINATTVSGNVTLKAA